MNCPTCGDLLGRTTEREYWWDQQRTVFVDGGWAPCEECAEDAVLQRMRKRSPWLFRQTGVVDEHDVMAQMVAAGHDGWPARR